MAPTVLCANACQSEHGVKGVLSLRVMASADASRIAMIPDTTPFQKDRRHKKRNFHASHMRLVALQALWPNGCCLGMRFGTLNTVIPGRLRRATLKSIRVEIRELFHANSR